MNEFGILRPIAEDESELMRSWRNAPQVRANMYTRHEISAQEHAAWRASIANRRDQAYFMYEFQQKPLGIVGFTKIDTESRNCSWAFYAAPDAPRGSGSRMEFLALEHAFGHMGLHKLHCEVLDFNAAVIQMHQKFGFSIEGRLRQHHKLDDQFADIVLLGLLSKEWASTRPAIKDKLIARLRS